MILYIKIILLMVTQIQQYKRATLLHDTWGRRSTNKRREKKRAVSPSTTHNRLYIFLFFFILGEGGVIEGKQHEKDMKELCPNTSHGEEAQTQDESTNRERAVSPFTAHR